MPKLKITVTRVWEFEFDDVVEPLSDYYVQEAMDESVLDQPHTLTYQADWNPQED